MSTLFDFINLDEKYKYTLLQTKKSKKIINILSSAFDRSLSPDIDSLWKFKFTLPFYIEDPITKAKIENPEYLSIKTENLILLKIGEPSHPISQSYYIIKNTNESTDGLKMDVECVSREQTLDQNTITIDGIERELINNEDNTGILNLIEARSTWKIGFIDENCRFDNINGGLVKKYRWMDALSKPILKFLREEVCSAYNLIVTFDTFNKLINIFDRDSYGIHSGILLSSQNYIKDLKKSTKSDSVCTRLEVSGKDGMEIRGISLDSTNYITNYDYYISTNQMSSELVLALTNYNNLLVAKDVNFKVLKSQLDDKNATLVIKESELSALEELLKGYNLIRASYIALTDNVNLPGATNNVNTTKMNITNKKAEIVVLNTQISAINVQISQIASDIYKPTCKIINTNTLIFNSDLLEELDDFTLTEPFSSDVYVTPYLLKQAAEKVLAEQSIPIIEQVMELADIFSIKEAQHIWSKIKLGDLVRAYCPKLKTNIDVRIVSYSYNIDSKSLSIVFSNKNKKLNDAKSIGSKIDKGGSPGKYLTTKRLKWDEIEGTKNAVDIFLKNKLDVSRQEIIGMASKNKISITESGIFVEDATDSNRQIAILASVIGITSDGWQSCGTAMDSEGVYSKYLVGQILLGEQLYIQNEDGTVGIDGLGITIKDTNGVLKVKIGKLDSGQYGIAIYNANGQIVLDDTGQQVFLPYMREDNLDASNNLDFLIRIPPRTQSVREAKLSFKVMNYRAYEKSVVGGASSNETSGASSDSTSADGGDHSHIMFDYFGTDVPFSVHVYSGRLSSGALFQVQLPVTDDFGDPAVVAKQILTYGKSGSHTHSNFHTHQNPHFHITSLNYGIIKSTLAHGIKVYVDGVLVADNGGLGYDSDTYDIELKDKLQTVGWHTISLSSTQNGRILADLEIVAFVNS